MEGVNQVSTADVAVPVKAERSNHFPRHSGSIFADVIRTRNNLNTFSKK